MLKNLIAKYGIKPSKKLGQNFLINKSILEKIISAAAPTNHDVILEIGPGFGVLTVELAKRAKKVVAVEKDKTLCRALKDILRLKKINNVEIINGDILKIFNEFSMSNYKIVANLPYYITSPVIRKFLETENRPELMVLMVQKEVAQRICSKNKMSLLAVAVQFYAQPEIVAFVPKNRFYPQPKVDSAIIKIIPKKNLPEINTAKFFALVKVGFSAKRKFLINNLKKFLKVQGSEIEEMFNKIKINPKSRAEELKIDDWIKVYENIEKDI